MLKKYKLFLFFFILLLFCYIVWFVYPYFVYAQKKGLLKVIFYPTSALVKTDDKLRTNLVLLGLPGGTHDGFFLTDSIQVVSFNQKTKEIVIVAVPRDIWSEEMRDKINSAYFYGWYKHGDALYWLKPQLKKITGFAPDYYLAVDFEKFKKLIDYLGGIEVKVERSFTDNKFPIPGLENDECNGDKEYRCRYQTVSFKQGWQHMDGELALKFARSRNAVGEEGTDFAREKRQQKVMQALFEKITSSSFILSRDKFIGFVDYADKLFDKNISLEELLALARTYFLNKKKIVIKNIDLSEDLFYTPFYEDYDGRYVLLPKEGFSRLRQYIDKKINEEN